MKKILVFVAALAFAGAAVAQQFKWVDKDGKVRYGDTPPPGVKATPMKAAAGPPAVSAPAGKDPAAKDVKRGPLTPAEQEQEYRKRQAEAKKAADKADQESKDLAAKRENCDNAKEMLRTLESGQRIARTDPQGERYYLDDAQSAAETAKARQSVQQWCS